jgi:hypothetical protein
VVGVSLADEQQYYKVLWYGDAGTAKTTNLATLANLGRMVFVEAEAGLKNKPLLDMGVNTANIDPFRDIRYASLDDMFWDLHASLEDNPGEYAGVGFDSLSEIVKKLVEQVTDKEFAKKVKKLEQRGESTEDLDPLFIDISYYGTMTEQMRRLTRKYRDLPCHIGFTALERRDVDEDTGKVAYGPAVNPAFQNDIVGYVDVVIHTTTDGQWPDGSDVMIGQTRKNGKYGAKDRFHATPITLVDPTFERVIKYIEGELTAENDERQQAYRELWKQRRAEEEAKKAERTQSRRDRVTGAPTSRRTAAPA